MTLINFARKEPKNTQERNVQLLKYIATMSKRFLQQRDISTL